MASSTLFSTVLREATKDVHRQAEHTGFIADLLQGRATRAGYALYLRNLVPIYDALERALDERGHMPPLASFADTALRRLPALTADLAAIAGPDWRETCALLPAAEAYAHAIERAGLDDGNALAAHAYARYLGDLSGGQILKPLLARLYGFGPDALTFYDFPALADLAAAKRAIRDALDEMPPAGRPAEVIVAAAEEAFRRTIAMSEAIRVHLAA